MESWNINELQVDPHQPRVLDSESEGRAIVINLPKGEQLQEHQVHERAWVVGPQYLPAILALAEHDGRRVTWLGGRAA